MSLQVFGHDENDLRYSFFCQESYRGQPAKIHDSLKPSLKAARELLKLYMKQNMNDLVSSSKAKVHTYDPIFDPTIAVFWTPLTNTITLTLLASCRPKRGSSRASSLPSSRRRRSALSCCPRETTRSMHRGAQRGWVSARGGSGPTATAVPRLLQTCTELVDTRRARVTTRSAWIVLTVSALFARSHSTCTTTPWPKKPRSCVNTPRPL